MCALVTDFKICAKQPIECRFRGQPVFASCYRIAFHLHTTDHPMQLCLEEFSQSGMFHYVSSFIVFVHKSSPFFEIIAEAFRSRASAMPVDLDEDNF